KFDKDLVPFIAKDKILLETMSSGARATHALATNYRRGGKAFKDLLKGSVSRPEFPDSEWNAIIQNKVCDFDAVLSSIHSPAIPKSLKEKVGAFEIKVEKDVEVTKTVTNEAQWNKAFRLFKRATLHLFPHRDSELATYENHMGDLFLSIDPSLHPRLISYDKAVRNLVANRGDLTLADTNHDAFRNAFRTHIENYGAFVVENAQLASTSSLLSPSRDKRPKVEICKRFNQGICVGTCHYAHVCSRPNCRRQGHGAHECKEGKTE
ncbi:hypothetical protein K435DRAFT_701264, partial [Dendrothele bispora CBS 962.96]